MATRDQLLDYYGRMLLIRRFEERVITLADRGAFRGRSPVYIGQEATAIGAMMGLGPEDFVFSTHRNHGHLLARGVDPKALMAEILGRETGLNRGRCGTFHPSAPEVGILHTTAIVGGGLPLAAGAAIGCIWKGSSQVTLTFIGEGSLNEGAFQESINLAVLLDLPLIMLCENNDVEAATAERASPDHAARNFAGYGSVNRARTVVVDGADVLAVAEAVSEAAEAARAGSGPTFIEARTKTWPGNTGESPQLVTGPFQVEMAWNEAAMPEEWRLWWSEHDPVVRFTRRLIETGVLDRAMAVEMDRRAAGRAAEAEEFASRSPDPDPASVRDHVFV